MDTDACINIRIDAFHRHVCRHVYRKVCGHVHKAVPCLIEEAVLCCGLTCVETFLICVITNMLCCGLTCVETCT